MKIFYVSTKKICYKSRLAHFIQLEDFAHALKHLYTDLLWTPSKSQCKDCYKCVLELVRSTDNVVDKDENLLPSILIRNIRKNLILKKSIENYVKKKKKKILSTLSNILDVKLNNIYEVFIKANESTICL